ncbi:MAG TPA: hypothetical protein V6D19_23615 [Stenomitos sp.]
MTTFNYRMSQYTVESQNEVFSDAIKNPTVEHEAPSPNLAQAGKLPVPQPVQTMTYRGVTYERPMSVATPQAIEATRPVAPTPAPVSSSALRNRSMPRFIEPKQRRSVLEYLQARLKVAKAHNDAALVSLLQREIQLLF